MSLVSITPCWPLALQVLNYSSARPRPCDHGWSLLSECACCRHDAKQKEEETPSYAKIVPSLAVSCSPPCATKWQVGLSQGYSV